MRVGYLGAAVFGLGIVLAGAGSAATVPEPLVSFRVATVAKTSGLVFETPSENVIVAEPAPNCAADGPGCPQFVPPDGGNGDFGEIPLPAPIFALAAGIVALVGLGRRRRSA